MHNVWLTVDILKQGYVPQTLECIQFTLDLWCSMVTNGYRTDTGHVLIIFICCVLVLYSGPHPDSSAVCWPWTQILLSREQIWLVSKNYYINYAHVTDTKFWLWLKVLYTGTCKPFQLISYFAYTTLISNFGRLTFMELYGRSSFLGLFKALDAHQCFNGYSLPEKFTTNI